MEAEGKMTVVTDYGLGLSEEVDAVSLKTAMKVDEENSRLRGVLEWVLDEVDRQREGGGGDLRTIWYFVEKSLGSESTDGN